MHAYGHDIHMTTRTWSFGPDASSKALKITYASSSNQLKKMKLVVCLCMKKMVPLEIGLR